MGHEWEQLIEHHYDIFKYAQHRCPIHYLAVMYKKEPYHYLGVELIRLFLWLIKGVKVSSDEKSFSSKVVF